MVTVEAWSAFQLEMKLKNWPYEARLQLCQAFFHSLSRLWPDDESNVINMLQCWLRVARTNVVIHFFPTLINLFSHVSALRIKVVEAHALLFPSPSLIHDSKSTLPRHWFSIRRIEYALKSNLMDLWCFVQLKSRFCISSFFLVWHPKQISRNPIKLKTPENVIRRIDGAL